MTKCPNNYFIDGAQVRYEDPQGSGDDTALNGLRIRCRNPADQKTTEVLIDEGYWGGWKPWVTAPLGKYACGAEERFEKSQGGGDDTAMNGLIFGFCDLKIV